MNHPNQIIIHIGYSKCMSTWLQKLFRLHPEINYAYKTNFFGIQQSNYSKGLKWYFKQFKGGGHVYLESDEHLLLPEIDFENCISKSNLDKFLLVINNMINSGIKLKIIYVYRDVTSMIVSRYCQFIKSGGSINFKNFLNKFHSNGMWKEYFDYRFDHLHSILQQSFGNEHVFAINLNDFKKEKIIILNKLSEFVGVDLSNLASKIQNKNVTPSYYCIKLLKFINSLLVIKKKCASHRVKSKIGFYPYKIITKFLIYLDLLFFINKKHHLFIDKSIRNKLNENVN